MADLSKKEARRFVGAVNAALRADHPPPGTPCGSKIKGAVRVAAEKLGKDAQTFRETLAKVERLHKLAPDWALYKAPVVKQSLTTAAEKTPEAPADPLVVRRLNDQLAQERAGRRDAERAAITAEGLRQGVFKLAATPPSPQSWDAGQPENGKHREVIVLPISDVHMGEVIDIDQMDGRNAYNKVIAANRLERLFKSVVKLGTAHWRGPAPAAIYVVLLGDLITGEIHEELAKTNDLLSIPAVRELSGHLIAGLDLLLRSFDCEIRVVSLPGNHGRTTRKPEAKGSIVNSYDTLV
ncbi:MAG TPA: hypothetical protein VGF02_14770, partial [Pseudolabrys sp.]